MPIKTDLNGANVVHKDQFKINAGGKDRVTKTTWLYSALWILHMLVISKSTRDNMSLSPTGQLLYTAELMDRDGYPKGLISRQQYYCTSNVYNSPSQGFCKLSKATNELQGALGLGRQVFRRGFLQQELAAPQDPPQDASAAVQTPRPQGAARKDEAIPQPAAHIAKAEPDIMHEDVESELGVLRTLLVKSEVLTIRKRKPHDRKDQAMASIAHAVFACNSGRLSRKEYSRPAHRQLPLNGRQSRKTRPGATMARGPLLFSPSVQSIIWSNQGNSNTKIAQGMNRKAQKGATASTFSPVYSIGIFRRNVVQSANLEQSESDCFGPPAARLSEKKRTQQPENLCENLCIRQAVEAEYDRKTTASSQLSHIDSSALLGVRNARVAVTGTPDLAPLQVLTRVGGIYRRFRVLHERVTDNATPLVKANDVIPDFVSTSSDEDNVDRRCALSSLAAAGVKLSTAPSDNTRTRRMAFMASFHYPDAIVCRGMDADGSVAVTTTTTTLYEHALEDVSDPRISSRASRKAGNFGKRNGKTTTVSKRLLRPGVMNRDNASRDESPLRPRRPSFNTDAAVDSSTLVATGATGYDHFAGDAGAALTTFLAGGGM